MPQQSSKHHDTCDLRRFHVKPMCQSVVSVCEVHDQWEGDEDMAAAFKEMTKTHNEMYNPTGVPWKPKRASEAPLGATVESRAVALPAASTTKDALATKGDLASILGTEPNYELLVCRDGHLWVHALNDGVLSDQLPLCGCGNYQYVLGQEADQVSQGDGALSIYS